MGDDDAQTAISNPRYQLIAPIGRGGMAELFLVMMHGAGGIGKLVVLKRIWPELAADPHILAMFLDEARLAVRMTHPNVVQTYEVFDDNGRVTLAMEYLDGQPLGRVLNRMRGAQSLSLPSRLRVTVQVLAGLHYAHELRDYDGTPLSVVHRDVGPPNVFLTYDGAVKLIDFGIAKNLASAHQTRPGVFKGRFSYVAPEQFLGRPVDRRTDVFSVGVMLWEMLAGRRFWSGATDAEIAARLISAQPLPDLPPDPAIPAGLAAICARALQLDAGQRYATAAEMQGDVQRALADLGESDDRMLGKAVASGFAGEVSQRRLLIDQNVRRVRSGTYPTPSSGSLPRPVMPPAPRRVVRPLTAAAMGATVTGLLVLLMVSLLDRRPAGEEPAAAAHAPARAATGTGILGSPAIERLYLREPSSFSEPPADPAPPAAAPTGRRRGSRAGLAAAAAASRVPLSAATGRPDGQWSGRPPVHSPPPPRPIDTTNPFLPAPGQDPDAGAP